MLSHGGRRRYTGALDHVRNETSFRPSIPPSVQNAKPTSAAPPSDPPPNILFIALKQSRYSYINFVFPVAPIRPSSQLSNPGVVLIGTADLRIGPHVFYDTRFYKVDIAPPTPSSQSQGQIVFEFKENRAKAFVLPPSVLEIMTTEPPHEITAALYSPPIDGSWQNAPQQGLIVTLSKASQRILDGLTSQFQNVNQLVEMMMEKSRTLPILKKVSLDFNARLPLSLIPPKTASRTSTSSLLNAPQTTLNRGAAATTQPATPTTPTTHLPTPTGVKSCATCGTTTTVAWRGGPLGPRTLCNACGVKWHSQKKKTSAARRKSSDSSRKRSRQGASSARKRVQKDLGTEVEATSAMMKGERDEEGADEAEDGMHEDENSQADGGEVDA
ncbi:hypothetical protein SeLEV6574_g04217 [Synchytrium endobioticum]|nr:hypothetical protein SeLEV6574_g04217 [Synchytrium endobioticum]